MGFTDRARVLKVGDRTCIPSRCFSGVLLVDEFNPDQPGKHQLKYYAPGVGNVRVGWSGANEDSKETLVLVALERVGARAMAKARSEALKLEASAYRTSKSIYGRTAPAERATVQTGSLGWARLVSRSSLRGAQPVALRSDVARIVITARVTSPPPAAARDEDRGDPPGRQDRPHAVVARRHRRARRSASRCRRRSSQTTPGTWHARFVVQRSVRSAISFVVVPAFTLERSYRILIERA